MFIAFNQKLKNWENFVMICEKCLNQKHEAASEFLLFNSNLGCANCQEIEHIILKRCIDALSLYKQDILNWFRNHTPIIMDGNMGMIHIHDFEYPFCSEDIQISKVVQQLNIHNIEYSTRDEKFKVSHQILGSLYDLLQDELKINPWECLFMLMICLEINRYLALSIVGNLNGHLPSDTPPNDNITKAILNTYKVLKQYKEHIPVNINDLHLGLESLLASDRIGIEHGIRLSVLQIQQSSACIESAPFNKSINFALILECLRSLHTIDHIKHSFTDGENKNNPILIYSDGKIQNAKEHSGLSQIYVEDMTSSKEYYDTYKYESEINEIVQKHLQFSLTTIHNILKNSLAVFKNGDEFLFGNTEMWVNSIKDLGTCSKFEAEQIFKYFSYNTSEATLYGNLSIKDNSVMRKPIIAINGMAVSVVNIWGIGLGTFIANIFNGEIHNDILNRKLAKIYTHIDTDFEYAVIDEIRKNIPAAIIKNNITELSIPSIQTSVADFPGQIDILVVYRYRIFVLECKNLNLKIDAKSMTNDYNKLTKNNIKSIQGKLDRKVMWVTANLESVINYMDADRSKAYSVNGVIVCSNFSFSSQDSQKKYPVITWTRFCHWLENLN